MNAMISQEILLCGIIRINVNCVFDFEILTYFLISYFLFNYKARDNTNKKSQFTM